MCASHPFAAPGAKAELEEGTALTPRFGPDGLITCVTTDAETGELLMLAHMNAEALSKTIETGEGWYWSRSRGELWHKGETSGQIQSVVEMRIDCDQDAVWLKVRVAGDGGCCHTGRRSCFYRRIEISGGRPTLVST
jgi:phosphoribosyl-AMP cyclohydrolase